MTESKSAEILKNAILLEKRGKALYESFGNQTSNEDVRDFFLMMAKEEDKHIDILSQQFRHFKENSSFKALELEDNDNALADILTEKIVKAIESASFEAAAISAAINLEEKAVLMYCSQAENTGDAEEKKLYEWLANWEKTHVEYLIKIDEQLREKIWFDNHFWPM